MNDLSFDKLLGTIKKFEDTQPQFNNEGIDDMISKGNKIECLSLIHSLPELRDMSRVKTKHGYIDLLFNRMLEYGTLYIIIKPEVYFKGE